LLIENLQLRDFFWVIHLEKKGDNSIGDAINWEWIVKCAEQSGKAIIVVSRDTDYGTHYENDSFLDDWLHKEFKERISRKRKNCIYR
jgi:hypothetical protein